MSRITILSLMLALTGCQIENSFGNKTDDVTGKDDVDTDDPVDTDTDIEPKEEICNGEDDDLDGLVDEGFSDLDGDGIADCVDDTCEVIEEDLQDIAVVDECAGGGGTTTNPWDVNIEWQWSGGSFAPDSAVAPFVANLTDTNGDGVVSESDTPNVIVTTFSATLSDGAIQVLEGDSGTEVWVRTGFSGLATPAVADVDSDGSPDIVAFDRSGCLTMLDASGTTQWTAASCESETYPQMALADLLGDGAPEIITNNAIYDGATGSRVVVLSRSFSIPYTAPSVGDIDLDGQQEVIVGNQVFSPDGTLEWQAAQTGSYGHWSAIVNADSDSEAEVVMVGGAKLVVYEHDGTTKWQSTLSSNNASPPCAADFDGDGETEIAWAAQGAFLVFDLDGTQVWSTTVTDMSGLSGCSGYDVDGDGAYEVLYADEGTFYLFDGKTGAVNYSNASHNSATLFEYPTVADVDGDGSAEILYVSNYFISGGSGHSLTVLGHAGDGWAKSGPSWSVFDFAVSNVNQDATLPSTVPLYWLDHNVYRARPIVDDIGIDLGVIIHDVCFTGCMNDSIVKVAVQVGNQGADDAEANIPITLYAADGDVLTPIETKLISTPIPSGKLLPSIVFEITAAFVGSDGFVVRVDDDGSGNGTVVECDEENNEDEWTDSPCP